MGIEERLRARAFRLATRDFNGDGAMLAKDAADCIAEMREALEYLVSLGGGDCLDSARATLNKWSK